VRIGRVVTLGIAIGAIAGGLVAQDGEEVIFVGAGNAGSWHTEFEFSNGLNVPIHAGFVILEKADEACVMGFCPGKGFDMPANGSVREDSIGPPVVWDGVRTYWLIPMSGSQQSEHGLSIKPGQRKR
jgi:hypothetical protein